MTPETAARKFVDLVLNEVTDIVELTDPQDPDIADARRKAFGRVLQAVSLTGRFVDEAVAQQASLLIGIEIGRRVRR